MTTLANRASIRSIAASRPRKCISICVIPLAICVLANSKKKKRNENSTEEQSHFAFSLRVAWLVRSLTTRRLAAAFCSSSFITLIIIRIRLEVRETLTLTTNISLPCTPYLVSIVLCCVFSLQYSLLFRCRFRAFVVATYNRHPLISALTH